MNETGTAGESLKAIDLLDGDGSVVKSAIKLADAVIAALNSRRLVEVSFSGLKGASSSYFNVFLRRINEACGLQQFQQHVKLQFGSPVQKMMYDSSLRALSRGTPKAGDGAEAIEVAPKVPKSWWKRLLQGVSHRSGLTTSKSDR